MNRGFAIGTIVCTTLMIGSLIGLVAMESSGERPEDARFAVSPGCWLRSCAAADATGDYGSVRHMIFGSQRSTWWIWDKAEEQRLMIGPNVLRAIMTEFRSGLSLSQNGGIDALEYERAVREYLAERDCRIVSSRRLDVVHREFRYRC